MAGVIIPLLLYLFIVLNTYNYTEDWEKLIVVACAACLMSGMGITISFTIVAILGAYTIVVYKRWKRIPLWIASIVPSVASSIVYFYLKG